MTWTTFQTGHYFGEKQNKIYEGIHSLHVIRICRSRYVCAFNLIFKMKKNNKISPPLFFDFHHSSLSFFLLFDDLNSRQSVYTCICISQLYNQFIPKYDLYKAGQVEGGGNSVEVLFDSVGSLVSMVGLSFLLLFFAIKCFKQCRCWTTFSRLLFFSFFWC